MSFDLAVWRPAELYMTGVDAARLHAGLCARPFQSFVPSPEMAAFVDAVLRRYRQVNAAPSTPWAAEPDVGQDCALMPIQSSLAAEMLTIIREIARDRGLILFDPQVRKVYQSGPNDGPENRYILELADGGIIYGPDGALIGEGVSRLSEENWFLILERSPGAYVQVGVGEQAGASAGQFVVEYRDGDPERHWRALLSNADGLTTVFEQYLLGDMSWTSQYSWRPMAAGL